MTTHRQTLRHMPTVIGYTLLARTMRHGGYSCLQIADAMLVRMGLDEFDYDALNEADKQKYDDLATLVDAFARGKKP